jgi:hypothetical protein
MLRTHALSQAVLTVSNGGPSFQAKSCSEALHKMSRQSAKGAEYESQGQARSEVERVAPGERKHSDPALKARHTCDISAFQALFDCISQPGATCLALLGTCPRLSYSAPLALCFDFLAFLKSRN